PDWWGGSVAANAPGARGGVADRLGRTGRELRDRRRSAGSGTTGNWWDGVGLVAGSISCGSDAREPHPRFVQPHSRISDGRRTRAPRALDRLAGPSSGHVDSRHNRPGPGSGVRSLQPPPPEPVSRGAGRFHLFRGRRRGVQRAGRGAKTCLLYSARPGDLDCAARLSLGATGQWCLATGPGCRDKRRLETEFFVMGRLTPIAELELVRQVVPEAGRPGNEPWLPAGERPRPGGPYVLAAGTTRQAPGRSAPARAGVPAVRRPGRSPRRVFPGGPADSPAPAPALTTRHRRPRPPR